MGWNSTIVVLNDGLHDIARDKTFGFQVSNAICELNLGEGTPVDIGAYARAIEQHHADGTTLVAVGGNTGHVLGEFRPYSEDDIDVRLLKCLADKLGYRVSRKPKRKNK